MKRNVKSVRDRAVLLGVAFLGIYMVLMLFIKHYYEFINDASAAYAAVYSLLIVLVLLIAAWGLQVLLGGIIRKLRLPLATPWLAVILVLVTILPRLFLILTVEAPLTSDFKMYYDMTTMYADTGYYNNSDYSIVVAPNLLYFIIIMGEVFKVFGSSVFVAQIMNLVLLTASIVVFYLIACQFVNKDIAFLAALIYTLSPSSILYSLSVSTEPMALFPHLLAILLALYALSESRLKQRLLKGLACGAVFAFSSSLRTDSIAFVFIFILLYPVVKGKATRRKSLSAAVAILVGIVAFQSFSGLIENEVFQKETGIGFGWSLFEGMDINTFGGWSAENSQTLVETIEAYPTNEVQTVLLKKAIERVTQYSAAQWGELILRKGVNIWAYNDYATFVAVQEVASPGVVDLYPYRVSIVHFVNYVYWLLLCVLSINCLTYAVKRWNTRIKGEILLLYLPVIGMVFLHSFATSIPRYHYRVLPNFVLICCFIPYALHAGADKERLDVEVKQ